MRVMILLSLLLLTTCATKEELETSSILKVNPESAEVIKNNSFIKDVQFVRLSKDEAFIGGIDKIIIHDQNFYILDSRISTGIYAYNLEGELKFEITSYGKGPGEFMGPYDFSIDKEKNRIIIYDARGLKLSIYNLANGDFINDLTLDYRIRRFEKINDNYVFYLDNTIDKKLKNNIIVTNETLQIQEEYLNIAPAMRGVYFMMPMNFSFYDDHLFFTPHSDYSIYKYSSDNKFSKYLTIDFAERAAPAAYYQKYENNSKRWEVRGDAAYNISNYLETDNFYFFLFKINTITHYYIKSKKSGEVIHTTNEKLIDNSGIGPVIRWPYAIIENKLVWHQQPSKLLNYIHNKRQTLDENEWKKFQQENYKLMSFANSLSKDDNPYLILTEIDF